MIIRRNILWFYPGLKQEILFSKESTEGAESLTDWMDEDERELYEKEIVKAE